MINGIGGALAGLVVAQKKADAASRNIANANTDGYKKVAVSVEEGSAGEPAARTDPVLTSGPLVAEPSGSGEGLVEKSNVDLAEELTSLDLAKISFQANLKTLQTQDEMLGSLLDLFR